MPRPDEERLPIGWNLDMDEAPRNGKVIIAMGRWPQARAGFPRFVHWFHGAWRSVGSAPATMGDPLVCWAWMPREVLPFWPDEPTAPLGVVNTVGTA